MQNRRIFKYSEKKIIKLSFRAPFLRSRTKNLHVL